MARETESKQQNSKSKIYMQEKLPVAASLYYPYKYVTLLITFEF